MEQAVQPGSPPRQQQCRRFTLDDLPGNWNAAAEELAVMASPATGELAMHDPLQGFMVADHRMGPSDSKRGRDPRCRRQLRCAALRPAGGVADLDEARHGRVGEDIDPSSFRGAGHGCTAATIAGPWQVGRGRQPGWLPRARGQRSRADPVPLWWLSAHHEGSPNTHGNLAPAPCRRRRLCRCRPRARAGCHWPEPGHVRQPFY